MAQRPHQSPSPQARSQSQVGYYACFNLGSAVRYCFALLAERHAGPARIIRHTMPAPNNLSAEM